MTSSVYGDNPADPNLTALLQERRHLLNLGYRLLGSLADAEDTVQETYARWYLLSPHEQDAIRSPAAWLTTVAGRICLDQLRSARSRRERYVGEWIPEENGSPSLCPSRVSGPWRRTVRRRTTLLTG